MWRSGSEGLEGTGVKWMRQGPEWGCIIAQGPWVGLEESSLGMVGGPAGSKARGGREGSVGGGRVLMRGEEGRGRVLGTSKLHLLRGQVRSAMGSWLWPHPHLTGDGCVR